MSIEKVRRITDTPLEKIKQLKVAKHPPFKPFPVDVLPAPLFDLIQSLYNSSRFSPEFQAGAALSIFAGIAGNRYKVQVKPGWIEPCILWVPVVGDPSSMKTPALKTYIRPLWALEKIWQEEYMENLKAYKRKETAKELDEGEEEPKRQEVVISATTIEGLFKAHQNNQNGLLLFRDELIGWIKSMNQYRKGDDQEHWLSIYNNEPVKVTRATKETMMLNRAAVSVLGGIQPSVLSDLATQSKDSNGFTYRLSFVYPEKTTVSSWIEETVDMDLIDRYQAAVQRVVQDASNYDTTGSVLMQFEPKAKNLYIDWYNKNAGYIRSVSDHQRKGIYKKLEGACARIACVLQVMKWGYTLESNQRISEASMYSATKIVEYFRATSLKAHGVMLASDPKVEMAADYYKDGLSIREVARRVGVSKSQVSRWKSTHEMLFLRD